MTRATWPGTIRSGRRAGEYTDAARQADNAMRALFARRTPLERERTPLLCIPHGGGKHRAIPREIAATVSALNGLAAARRYRGL